MSNSKTGLKIALDASRNRSGGAKAHLLGILGAVDPTEFGVAEVHVWSYRELLDALPDAPWLFKHCPAELDGSILRQLWWQRFNFRSELLRLGIDVLLSTDAGTVCRFLPSVVMSRDMLSFEGQEMQRYSLISASRLRLWLLKYVQVSSLKNATGALFLTRYAAKVIQKYSGELQNIRVIPHGIGRNFIADNSGKQSVGPLLRCVYVSNADLYKHQWHVIEAVKMLRQDGHSLILELVGAGSGPASDMVTAAIARHDPDGSFVHVTPAVPHHRIPTYLADADVFIFASSCENMPNTLVEAMAAGVPIACSNRGPMPEILQDAGVYFDPESPEQIAHALSELIVDSHRRRELGMRAKTLSEQYSWERCAGETWRFLGSVGCASEL